MPVGEAPASRSFDGYSIADRRKDETTNTSTQHPTRSATLCDNSACLATEFQTENDALDEIV